MAQLLFYFLIMILNLINNSIDVNSTKEILKCINYFYQY